MKNLLLVWHRGKQKTWKRGWWNKLLLTAFWWPYCIAWRWKVSPHKFSLAQTPVTEPQHYLLRAEGILILLMSSKGRKWVCIMQVLTSGAMFLLLWQWQGLCFDVALKTLAASLSMRLYESKQICGNCVLLTCNTNNSRWYISDLYFSHFFPVVRVMTNVSCLMGNKIGRIEHSEKLNQSHLWLLKITIWQKTKRSRIWDLRFLPLVWMSVINMKFFWVCKI